MVTSKNENLVSHAASDIIIPRAGNNVYIIRGDNGLRRKDISIVVTRKNTSLISNAASDTLSSKSLCMIERFARFSFS